MYISLANNDAAIKIYENSLCTPPYNRLLLIEYARFLKKLGQESKMRIICNQVIELGNPIKSMDWYYQGFAFYLIGKLKEAEFFYNGSDKSLPYYST